MYSHNDVRLKIKEYIEQRGGTKLEPIGSLKKFFRAENKFFLIILDKQGWIGIPSSVLDFVKTQDVPVSLIVGNYRTEGIIHIYEGDLEKLVEKKETLRPYLKNGNYELHLKYGLDKVAVKENGIIIPRVAEIRPAEQEINLARALGIKL